MGHLGPHFDVMNKEFPLDFTERDALVFDVSEIHGRDIDICDINLNEVQKEMFIAFYSGYIETVGYGSKEYFSGHPQLSKELIDALLDKGVSLIGIDFAGVRRGKEHTPMDQFCADRGVFIIENMYNLKEVINHGGKCVMHTYPMNYAEMSGLPCRIVAKI